MSQLQLIICSGIHDFRLTEQFIANLKTLLDSFSYLSFPTDRYPAYSSWHLHQFIQENLPNFTRTPLIFMAFSAGVVAAIRTALSYHQNYHNIKALIAFDGWGVPLDAKFPIHRISHDYFTHWSSAILGTGKINFYADPPVNHLDLWRIPHKVTGWKIETVARGNSVITPIELISFLQGCLLSVSQISD